MPCRSSPTTHVESILHSASTARRTPFAQARALILGSRLSHTTFDKLELCAGGFKPLGIDGWRFAFLSVALVSIAIGVGNFLYAHDPRFKFDDDEVRSC